MTLTLTSPPEKEAALKAAAQEGVSAEQWLLSLRMRRIIRKGQRNPIKRISKDRSHGFRLGKP
jgi:hypothetical protein